MINLGCNYYEITWGIGRVCEICLTFFSKDNIEKIVQVFNVARGRFGIFEDQLIFIKDILRNFAHQLRAEVQKQIDVNELYSRIATTARGIGLRPLY